MRTLVARNNRRKANQRVVDTWIWYQVGLKFVEIHIESAIEAETRRNGADDLSDQAIQVLKSWSRNIQITTTNVIHGLVIN